MPSLEAPAEGFILTLLEFGILFDLMFYMVAKCIALRLIFRVEDSKISLGTRSGECDGWMIGRVFAARSCCTTTDVWLGTFS
jgi:hypothetical protein